MGTRRQFGQSESLAGISRSLLSVHCKSRNFRDRKGRCQSCAGTYTLSRRSETSFLKTASLLGQFTVSPVGDGDIEIPQLTGANGKPKHWQAVGPMTFLERGGQDKLFSNQIRMVGCKWFCLIRFLWVNESACCKMKASVDVLVISPGADVAHVDIVAGDVVCETTLRAQVGIAATTTIVSFPGAHRFLAGHHLHCISPGTFVVRVRSPRGFQR